LYSHIATTNTNVDQSWKTLQSAMEIIFSNSNNNTKCDISTWPARLGIAASSSTFDDITWIRQILRYHRRLLDMIRQESYPSIVKVWMSGSSCSSSSSKNPGASNPAAFSATLEPCLVPIRTWLVRQIAQLVYPYLLDRMNSSSLNDDIHDIAESELFRDDYGVDLSHGEHSNVSKSFYLVLASPLDLLPSILETAHDPISSDFVEDYLESFTKISATSASIDVKSAAKILFEQCLHRIGTALYTTQQFSGTVVNNRILALSTLLSISPTVRMIVIDYFDRTVSDHVVEKQKYSLQILFDTVAYVVPPIGSDYLSSSVYSPQISNNRMYHAFVQQLDETTDFPFNVWHKKSSIPSRDEIHIVLQESVSVMDRARTAAMSLLRVALKSGTKESIFSWIASVIHDQYVSTI
jgi:hypothetical protein